MPGRRGPPGRAQGGRRATGKVSGVKILLSGATGFIGRGLAPRLLEAGHDVRAMTRRPDAYDGPGTVVGGDTADPAALRAAMAGCEVAYYLVHGLDVGGDLEEQDARAAKAFGRAAGDAGIERIVYLGGLGRQGDDLSEHLASRQEVEGRLGQGGVPVTVLRAALVIGAGSASFELLRQFVANIPLKVVPPRAASTLVQPIAVGDVLRYLLEVLDKPETANRVYEVGGPDVLSYAELLARMETLLGKRGPSIPIPVIPRVAAKVGTRLFTNVDPQLAATLLDSLGNDVVVTDGNRLAALLPGPLAGVEEMLATALAG